MNDTENEFNVIMNNKEEKIEFSGTITKDIPSRSIFENLGHASEFFKNGSLGYSPSKNEKSFDGLELNCSNWLVKPLHVNKIHSSYFENYNNFPKGSVEFDCALLMNNIEHEWHSKKELCCG